MKKNRYIFFVTGSVVLTILALTKLDEDIDYSLNFSNGDGDGGGDITMTIITDVSQRDIEQALLGLNGTA